MKNLGKFQNSMRAVTINSEFSLPGLKLCNSFGHSNIISRSLLYMHVMIT